MGVTVNGTLIAIDPTKVANQLVERFKAGDTPSLYLFPFTTSNGLDFLSNFILIFVSFT